MAHMHALVTARARACMQTCVHAAHGAHVRSHTCAHAQAMDKLGVHRVGLADTVGVSTPFEVQRITAAVCLDPCDSL